jgi:Na+(H+)/acetate symporter ActP
MKLKIWLYSVLTFVGFVLPNYVIFQAIRNTGTFDLAEFGRSFGYNYYTQFTAADFLITASTVSVFYVFEMKKLGLRVRFLPIIGTFLVGVSFGFPMFLLLRELSEDKATNSKR